LTKAGLYVILICGDPYIIIVFPGQDRLWYLDIKNKKPEVRQQ
jgi:hypothetical protein